jgi:MoaA/NifB/PqqE/SkfB family radical SAM enzyme
MPNGHIPVCQFNTTPVGNLRHQTFDEIWFGEGMEKHRDWVKNCPGCWAECEVLPNAFYSGDIFKYLLLGNRRLPMTT